MLKGLSRFGKNRNQGSRANSVLKPERGETAVEHVDRTEGAETKTGSQVSEALVDGTISVLHGEVFVSEPRDGGTAATLFVPENSRVSVDIGGEAAEPGHYEVTGVKEITLKPMKIEPHYEIELHPSSDKMELRMSLHLQPGVLYEPKDSAPVNELSLAWTEAQIDVVPPSEAELLKVLEESEYEGGIDRKAVSELAAAKDSVERVVLRGTKVYPGKPEEAREVPLPAPDYADPLQRRMKLHAVKSGTVIGVIDAAVPPKSGKNIFGLEVLPKAPPRQELPDFGPGAHRIDNKIVAARAGRLVFTNRIVDVVPIVELNRLTAKDGQIVFDGDVKVYGDVEDGSLIKATGVIQVQGGVYGSLLVGEKGILIGGHCVNTKAFAGWAKDLASDMMMVVNPTLERLERYIKDVGRVLDDAREKLGSKDPRQLQMLPSAVLDKYHTPLPRKLHGLVEQYSKTNQHGLGQRLEPVIRLIQTHWVGPKLKELTMDTAVKLFNQLKSYRDYLEDHLREDSASVEIGALTSSTVDATGTVSVVGRGAYASHIDSGRSVSISGFARGGEIKAVESVSVRELGSPSGTETKVVVTNRDGFIKVATRHPNTVLEVGGNVNRNLSQEAGVTFLDRRMD